MILIGMFDSPFVRRVAVSMRLLGMSFEHKNWSVGRDAAEIKRYNSQGRVPALVLEDGEVLVESAAILDYLDERAGARALLPRSGASRRHALRLMGIATTACDKGVAHVYERVFRPAEHQYQPWLDRCRVQIEAGLAELDQACAALAPGAWLLGAQMQQPDITAACAYTFLIEAVGFDATRYPALAALVSRCEALPEFQQFHVPFFVPTSPK